MKLKEWALAAEVFSALAVFVTLIVLLLEVRAGNELTRVASFQDVLLDYNHQRYEMLDNPELVKLVMESNSGVYPEWGTLEAYQLRLIFTNDFNTFDIAFSSYNAGILGEPEWARIRRPVCSLSQLLPEAYKREIYLRMTDDAVTYLEEGC